MLARAPTCHGSTYGVLQYFFHYSVCQYIRIHIYIYIYAQRERERSIANITLFHKHSHGFQKKRNINCTNSLHAHMLDITIPASASCLHCFFVWFIGLSTCVGLWVAGLGCWHWGWVDAFLAGLGSIYVE